MYKAKYFKESEYSCKCGCGYKELDEELLKALDGIREMAKRPLIITSGCRCSKHNANVGGAKNSLHTKGRAVDIKATTGKERLQIVKLAIMHGITGYGVNKNFVHLSLDEEKQEGLFVY